MTKKEIRQQFLLSIKGEMLGACQRLVDNANFDNLWRLFSSKSTLAYSLFFPIHVGDSFQHVYRLFCKMVQDIEFVGDLSLVCATVKFKKLGIDEEYIHNDIFVMCGHHYELDVSQILKNANFHLNEPYAKLSEYHACRLDWDGLKFMADLAEEEVRGHEEFKAIKKQWETENSNNSFPPQWFEKLMEFDDLICQKQIDYIKSRTHTFVSLTNSKENK